ncbi:Oidioi.mRNA.OKI2018_I69.PAR.g10253.t1.cds [Oikopleura dioica]|uniref:chitin synthase n=1 Tax=Oikopleura dioica TaxID=34765 RepID=A0ABN7RU52_OIKDI|nr:Oidioi.mRNA.OKI2018_I69.PAR.g10253.t1.cds [Oikopleura dioica]
MRMSRKTKVQFEGESPPTSATTESAADKISHPSNAGFSDPQVVEAPEDSTEQQAKKADDEKTEPWNIAKTEPNITEFALPSSKSHRNRIILWHTFNILIGVLCVVSNALQYFSFAEMNNEFHIASISEDTTPGGSETRSRILGGYQMEYRSSRNAEDFTEFKILFAVLLIPEFYTFLYCLYFAIFKRPPFPKFLQILVTCVTEMIYAVGVGFYVFYLAPDISRTMNVAVLMFPTAVPLVFSLFQDKTVEEAKQAAEEANAGNQQVQIEEKKGVLKKCCEPILSVLKKFAPYGQWIFFTIGHVMMFFDTDDIVKSLFVILCVNMMSVPNYINFSICPSNSVIATIHSVGRGIKKKSPDSGANRSPKKSENKKQEDPELSIIISHLFATPMKCIILALIVFLPHDNRPSYEHPGDNFQLWMIVYAISTVMTSYLQKVSVKLGLQKSGLAVSGALGPLIALCAVFFQDATRMESQIFQGELEYENDHLLFTEVYPQVPGYQNRSLSDTTRESSTIETSLIMSFVTGLLGILHLLCLTQYIWTPRNFIYPLDRHVFMLPAFRPVGTSTFSLLNRRTIDIIEEQESDAFNKEFSSGSKKTTRVSGRKTNKSGMWSKGQKNPYIFICTTLWHEEDFEMATLLRSVVKLLRHARMKKNDPSQENQYELEMHIFFDNVFVNKPTDKEKEEVKKDKQEREEVEKSDKNEDKKKSKPKKLPTDDFIDAKEWMQLNEWVVQFQTVFKDVLSKYEDNEYITPKALEEGKIIRTPYGGRVVYKIAGYDFVIHLKDAELVQRGKRWSQVMYLYYLIGWKIDACELRDSDNMRVKKSKSFVLALDGDVDFEPDAFELVLDRCMRNDKLAACCGAIHPKGSGWLVAYQNFEYAVGHWLQKAAEHVLGCVLCSPGCFSLMRVSYLSEPNVMAMYKSLALNPMEKLQYDQGEDRWLCTLMLFSGGRIEYEGSSHCNTFAPEDLPTFYKQRRRWGPSTTANIWNLVAQQKLARSSNPYISVPYILYQFTVMVFALIGVSTTMMMVAEAFSLGVGNSIPRWVCYFIVIFPVAIFTMACYLSNDGDFQIQLATWFSLAFSFLMALVFIGIFIEGMTCPFSPSFMFFVAMAGIHIVAAILHWDFYALLCGVVYFLFIPSCFIFLQIYSIANLNDCSWGTRQAASTDKKVEKTFWQRVTGKNPEQIRKEEEEGLDGTNCACLICMDSYDIRSKEEGENKSLLKKDEANTKDKAKTEEPKNEDKTKEKKKKIQNSGKLKRKARPETYYEFVPTRERETFPVEKEEDLEKQGIMKAKIEGKIKYANNKNERRKSQHQTAVGDESSAAEASDKVFLEPITQERLYGGFTIKTLRSQDERHWCLFMNNPRVKEENRKEKKPKGEFRNWKLEDVRDREIKLYKKFQSKYLSWVLGDGSPFHKNCKVYTLSNPEQEFWERMQDPTDGFIGIKKKGRNSKTVEKHENKLAEEMTKFKDEKFMYFIFINILWIIVSCTILKYSYLLGHIDIPINNHEQFPTCGMKFEDEDEDNQPCENESICDDCIPLPKMSDKGEPGALKKTSRIPRSVFDKIVKAHGEEGEFADGCFFDFKIDIVFDWLLQLKPYFQHPPSRAKADELIRKMIQNPGTQIETESLTRYFLMFRRLQLKNMFAVIKMRAYKNPSGLPLHDEIEDADEAASDAALSDAAPSSSASSSSIETIVPCTKATFKERERGKKNEIINMGRGMPVVFYKDVRPLDPASREFTWEKFIMYEYSKKKSSESGLSFENLEIWKEKNKKDSNCRKIVEGWKKMKTTYSPLGVSEMVLTYFPRLLKKPYAQKLEHFKNLLRSHTPVTKEVFDKKASSFGLEHQLNWDTEKKFKTDIKQSIDYWKNMILEKRATPAVGSQYTLDIRTESKKKRSALPATGPAAKKKALP